MNAPITSEDKAVERVAHAGHHFVLPYGAWDYECEFCFVTMSEAPFTACCPKNLHGEGWESKQPQKSIAAPKLPNKKSN